MPRAANGLRPDSVNCLVTGATGFIGRHLCQKLSGESASVLALSRGGGSLPDGTVTQALDLSRELPAIEQLRGVDAVFHLAGIAHQRAAPEDYDDLNHRAVAALARRAEQAGVRCFIYLSSVRAMGPAKGPGPRNEGELSPPDSPYGQSKWQAECDLVREFSSSDMGVYILRPPLVYGSGVGGNLETLRRAMAYGMPRPPAEGARSMIGVQDLADLMCALAAAPRPGVHTWIVSDGERYTLRDIYDALRTAAGKGPGLAWLPAPAWHALLALADILHGGAGQPLGQRLFGTDLYDNSALLAATGWRPRQTLYTIFDHRRAGGGAP